MPLPALALFALAVNFPLGFLRRRGRRFSWQWFLWAHLSLPLLATGRSLSGFGLAAVPWLIGAALLGQILGGRVDLYCSILHAFLLPHGDIIALQLEGTFSLCYYTDRRRA